jgi:hypothetical protein
VLNLLTNGHGVPSSIDCLFHLGIPHDSPTQLSIFAIFSIRTKFVFRCHVYCFNSARFVFGPLQHGAVMRDSNKDDYLGAFRFFALHGAPGSGCQLDT